MHTALLIIQTVLAVALILTVLMQIKGGGMGGIFGQQDSVYRTKRGVEKTLLQLTVILIVLFVIVAVATLKVT